MSNKITMKMSTNPRLLKDVLTLYRSTFNALKELIDNSIQARATEICINLKPSDCDQDSIEYHPIDVIEVKDNGIGVPFSSFKDSVMEIATQSKAEGQGVGRFGALQIGKEMKIETSAFDHASNKTTITSVTINASSLSSKDLQQIEFPIETEEVEGKSKSYYNVSISDLYSNSQDKIKKKNRLSEEFTNVNTLKQALFENYTFDIFENRVQFVVNGEQLHRDQFLLDTPRFKSCQVKCSDGEEHEIKMYFYKVNLKSADINVFFQAEVAGLKSSIARYSYVSPWHTSDAGAWYILVESDLITNDMVSDFALADFGNDAKAVQESIRSTIDDFFKADNRKFLGFIERLKTDKYYPYDKAENVFTLEEVVFNHTAYIIENNQKLLETSNQARTVIYPMIKRLIEDGNTEFLYEEILKLSDESREKFITLLDQTELSDVVEFTSSVARHTKFLDFLYDLCYGDVSEWLKERKQLHQIVKNELWLFGEQYTNTTQLWSDKNLENNLMQLHTKYFSYEPTEEDENIIAECKDKNHDITDLFFYNKVKLGSGRSEVIIVELKSPSCAIADNEITQIERYRRDIVNSSAYPRDKVEYKIILVSSKITDNARIKLQGAPTWNNPDDPFLYSIYNQNGWSIKLYVMEWSELIDVNRQKLSYLSDSLNVKVEDVGEVFKREYPHLLDEKSRNRLNQRALK